MRPTVNFNLLIALLFSFLVSVFFQPLPVMAEEPAEDFLNALREAGYYEVALEYLEEMETSDLASDQFKKILPFERAQTLIDSVGGVNDLTLLDARLSEAEQLLTRYASQATEPEEISTTLRYRGNLFIGRASMYRRQSQSDRLTAAEKAAFETKLREALESASEAYAGAREAMRTAIESFKIDAADPSTVLGRKRLYGYYTQIRLRQPIVMEELADTYPDGDAKKTELLNAAAVEYLDLYEDYGREYLAGLESKLFAARCYFKLGQVDDAMIHLRVLFTLGDNAAIKRLKQQALMLAADCWKTRDPYPFDEVIDTAAPVVATLSRTEQRDPDWLRVQLELGKASRMKAEQLKADNTPGALTQINALNRQSVVLVRNVARSSKELRNEANALIEAWDLSAEEIADDAAPPPANFAEALQVSQDAITAIESMLRDRGQIKLKGSRAADDATRAAAASELQEIQLQIDEAVIAALSGLESTMDLSDEKTERDDLNKVRYFQSFCYYAADEFVESAVIGKFMLDRYPQVNYTRQAAALAVRNYNAILTTLKDEDRKYEYEQLEEVCNAIVERWPGSPESGTAASAMCNNALIAGDLVSAEKYYGLIPVSYGSRGSYALQIGQRVWFKYSQEKDTLPEEEAKKLLVSARDFLESGVNQTDPSRVSYSTALSSRFLVNVYLANGEFDKAVLQLEEGPLAPLDLIAKKHPAIMNHSKKDLFVRETFKSAVNVYLAKLRDGGNQKTWIDKASGIIAAMREHAGTSEDGAKQVAAIYYLIAKELKEQFDALPGPDEKQKFSEVLSSFLGAIEKDSTDAKTVLWAGQTMLDVAGALSADGLTAAATPIYGQAVDVLNRAEQLGLANDPQLKWQRARAMRGNGRYEQAVEQLVEVIKERNSYTIQFDAAETLHQWAASISRSRGYAEAMGGAYKYTDPKSKRETNAVWGWKKLASATKDKPDYFDMYVNSMYYLIESRLEYGIIEKHQGAIDAAEGDFTKFRAREPAVSEGKYKARWDELGQRIDAAK